MDKIKELLKEGWKITFEEGQAYADRGDFNCPHKKEYDPKDGHGISQVWTDFDCINPPLTLEESIDKLYEKCKQVIPGKPYEKK